VTKLNINLAWIPAFARMTNCYKARRLLHRQ
jgi:hypothetical protein